MRWVFDYKINTILKRGYFKYVDTESGEIGNLYMSDVIKWEGVYEFNDSLSKIITGKVFLNHGYNGVHNLVIDKDDALNHFLTKFDRDIVINTINGKFQLFKGCILYKGDMYICERDKMKFRFMEDDCGGLNLLVIDSSADVLAALNLETGEFNYRDYITKLDNEAKRRYIMGVRE